MRRTPPVQKYILIVEDEPAVRDMVAFALRKAEMEPAHAADARAAQDLIAERVPDLILLDWMLPGMSGLELARRLRKEDLTRGVPIIMLTARGEESDRVGGLDAGVDDYVVKPFSPRELIARINAVIRRSRGSDTEGQIAVGELRIDSAAHRVYANGDNVPIGPTEYRLLEFFLEHPGRVFSREQLLDSVWGRDIYIDERTVDVHVGRLRKALNRGREADPIRTVRGAGYALNDRFGKTAEPKSA